MIFSFDKSTSLEGGSEKKPCDDQGGLPKNERKKYGNRHRPPSS